ncbi:hypothetical protein ACFVAF_32545 [Streptomyces sp. NPDC057596]|uniref:hypothetical protein n=1 Tax=Streptomyces sp. NPDC057596 TaxID=3346178 RepID=UPI003689F48C
MELVEVEVVSDVIETIEEEYQAFGGFSVLLRTDLIRQQRRRQRAPPRSRPETRNVPPIPGLRLQGLGCLRHLWLSNQLDG